MAAPVITQDMLLEYEQLHRSIAQLEQDQVVSNLKKAEAALSQTTEKLRQLEADLPRLDQQLHHYEKKVSHLSDHSTFHFHSLLGKKHGDERVARNVEKLAATKAEHEQCLALISRFSTEQQQQRRDVSTLKQHVDNLKNCQSREMALVDGMFAPYTPLADAYEVALRNSLISVVAPLNEVLKYRACYAAAHRQLVKGVKMLEQSAQLLQSAAALVQLDMMENTFDPYYNRMGGMLDAVAIQQTNEAVELAKLACFEILAAKNLCPDTPRVDMERVQGFQNVFLMIVFDNAFMDMMQFMHIHKQAEKVQLMLSDCAFGERWMRTQLHEKIDVDAASLQSVYESRMKALQAYRRQILDRAVAAVHANQTWMPATHVMAVPVQPLPCAPPQPHPMHSYPGLTALGYDASAPLLPPQPPSSAGPVMMTAVVGAPNKSPSPPPQYPSQGAPPPGHPQGNPNAVPSGYPSSAPPSQGHASGAPPPQYGGYSNTSNASGGSQGYSPYPSSNQGYPPSQNPQGHPPQASSGQGYPTPQNPQGYPTQYPPSQQQPSNPAYPSNYPAAPGAPSTPNAQPGAPQASAPQYPPAQGNPFSQGNPFGNPQSQQGNPQPPQQGSSYPSQHQPYAPQPYANYPPPQQQQGSNYPHPQQGSPYQPQPQSGSYPPTQQGGTYPPPQGSSYPPPQQGGSYPPQQQYPQHGAQYPPAQQQQGNAYPPPQQQSGYAPPNNILDM